MSATATSRFGIAICAILFAFFVFFIARGIGLEPVVFADEWLHSTNARLLPLTSVTNPSYLFYLIYRPTAACGPAFLDCARLVNVGFFVAAGLMFYLYALRHVATGLATLLLLIFLGSPNNVYVLFFSPDALFHSAFVIFFISLLLLDNAPRAIVAGALLGLLALIKINAIFMLPGVLLFLLVDHWIRRRPLSRLLANPVLTVLSFSIVKIGIGFAIAGRAGLSISGQQYAGIASSAVDLATIITRLPLFALGVVGYFSAAIMLIGMPLLLIVFHKRPRDERIADRGLTIGYAALCLLLPLLLAMGMLQALVVGLGPYESIWRISLRYFSFMLPFFYLMSFTMLAKIDHTELQSARTKIIASVVAVAVGVMIFVLSSYFTPNIVDSPELMFLTYNRFSFAVGSALLLLPLILVVIRPAIAAQGYVVSLLLLSLVGNAIGLRDLRHLRSPTLFDAAGRYAALFLGPERANVAVLGTDVAGLFRAMFHLNALGPIGITLRAETAHDEVIRQLQNKKWVLLVGPDALKFAPANTPAPTGFALVPYAALALRPAGSP